MERTMSKDVEFDRKAAVVSSAWDTIDGNSDWDAVTQRYNLGFPFANLHVNRFGTLNTKGRELVLDTYAFLLLGLGIEESEDYHSFWDMMEAYNNKPANA